MTVAVTASAAKPAVQAAVLLWGREFVGTGQPWPRTVAEVLDQTGAGKSQAYATLARLRQAAAGLDKPCGRPAAHVAADDQLAVLLALRDFLLDHPGATVGRGTRRHYSDTFRRFAVELGGPGGPAAALPVERLAETLAVPLGALKGWLRRPAPAPPEPRDPLPSSAEPAAQTGATKPAQPFTTRPEIATILAEWPNWHGTFGDFCRMLREQHGLPYGGTFIASVLQAAGLRSRRQRKRPAAPWSRATFRTLFPGAQWLGDGTTVALCLNDEHFAFNVEALVDPAPSAALVGVVVTDTEDEQAVLAAFDHGCLTTGAPPLALTLDNRPSNHSPAIARGVAPTTLLHATPGRPEAKAPVEGAFGLFRQTAPPLVVRGHTDRELARSFLALLLTLWAWTRNGKPRRRLGGRTPADAYRQDRPSPEEIEQAHAWITELQRRELLARTTRAARNDPVRRQLLEQGLLELDIAYPDHRLAASLACYATDAILQALATFGAKRRLGTLPPDAPPDRYVAGIVRRINERLELEHTADALLHLRLRQRDLTLEPLQQDLRRLRATLDRPALIQILIDRALTAAPRIEFRFWLKEIATEIAKAGDRITAALYTPLARRVAASFSTDRDRRAELVHVLAAAIAEIA